MRCIALQRAKGRSSGRPLLLLSQFLQHMLALLFSPRDCRTVTVALSRLCSPELLNYESPASFTFIYRCTIPLDLPPRFSRLLFPFFVPAPSNLLFHREIPFRLLSASERSFVPFVRLSVSRSIKSTLLRRIELNRISRNDFARSLGRTNESRDHFTCHGATR